MPDQILSVLEQMNTDNIGVVHDRGEPESVLGLHLQIFASGKRCFYFSYATRFKRRRRPKIGEGIGLAEARKIARNIKEQVAMGKDPKGDWDEKRKEKTVAEVFEILLKEYWSSERFLTSGRYQEAQSLFKKLERFFGGRYLSEVKASDVRIWHTSLSKTPIMANRCLEVLSTIFAHAFRQEWVDKNPCILVKAYQERKRKRVPTKAELRNILTTLRVVATTPGDKDCLAAIYLLALFYTGARPKSLAEARWDQEDSRTEFSLTLRFKGKMTPETGEEETVCLPKQILDLLALYPLREDGKIFNPLRARGLWKKTLENYKYKALWTRDARKAFASLGVHRGIPIDVVGHALNHKSATTTKRYAQEFNQENVTTTLVVAEELDKISGAEHD